MMTFLYYQICSFASNPIIYLETLTVQNGLVHLSAPPPHPRAEHDRGWVWCVAVYLPASKRQTIPVSIDFFPMYSSVTVRSRTQRLVSGSGISKDCFDPVRLFVSWISAHSVQVNFHHICHLSSPLIIIENLNTFQPWSESKSNCFIVMFLSRFAMIVRITFWVCNTNSVSFQSRPWCRLSPLKK